MVLEFHELKLFEKIAFKIAENFLMELEFHKLEYHLKFSMTLKFHWELEFHELKYQKSGKLLLISETMVDFHIFRLKVLQCHFHLYLSLPMLLARPAQWYKPLMRPPKAPSEKKTPKF